MKKVGILTFQFAHNYGAMLQAYSLRHYLSEKGVDVEIINYCPPNISDFYSINPFVAIKNKNKSQLFSIFKRIRQAQKFSKFQKDYLCLKKRIKDFKKIKLSDYSMIIVGSDQVWNEDIVGDNLRNYLLSDYSGIKVSFSASLGKSEISEKSISLFKNELPKFSMISVREKNNSDYLSATCGMNAFYTADPVFLNLKLWKLLAQESKWAFKNKYILFVDLFDDNNLEQKAIDYKNEHGLDIYSIHPMLKKNKAMNNIRNASPIDYLKIINDADIIFNN